MNLESRQLVISFPKAYGYEVKSALKQAADDEGRSVSNMTFRIIQEWLDKNGYSQSQEGDRYENSEGNQF